MRRIGILGGTGAEGFGLAARLARAGASVCIGSRDLDKARAAASRLGIEGRVNADAARDAGIVILTVPVAAQIATLRSVRDALRPEAIVIDATVPLEAAVGGRLSHALSLWSGSAAEQAARNVPPGVRVVAAFHCLSAELLANVGEPVDCDVLLCGDDTGAKAEAADLVRMIGGARPVDAGPLEFARYAESLAALLISLNLRHKVKHCGVRITGLPAEIR